MKVVLSKKQVLSQHGTPPNFRNNLFSMKSSSKMLQNLPYFIHTKIQSCFFHFSFRATLFFPIKNALVYVNIDQGIHQEKIHAAVHTPIHASVHAAIHALVHAAIHTPMHASSVHAPIHASACTAACKVLQVNQAIASVYLKQNNGPFLWVPSESVVNYMQVVAIISN